MFKLTGTLKVKNDTVVVSDKFSKREFVVTDNSSMYPQDIQFQLSQDKVDLLDSVTLNDTIEVSFNLRGREWVNPQGEAKYFNTLDAWKIEKVGVNNTPTANAQIPSTPIASNELKDDLPF